MKRTPDIILNDNAIIFEEDIYLFDSSGKIFSRREGKFRGILNVYALLSREEERFVRENLSFYGMKPLLAVSSELGVILIDRSLFGEFGMLSAIVPLFDEKDLLSLICFELCDKVRVSESVRALIEAQNPLPKVENRRGFVRRLSAYYHPDLLIPRRCRTNLELDEELRQLAGACAELYGISLDVHTVFPWQYELKNDISLVACTFILANMCLAARKYSAGKCARMDILFNDMGAYLEMGFEISRAYLKDELRIDAPELRYFFNTAHVRMLVCESRQDKRAFAIRAFPWSKKPNSTDIKQDKPKLL